ncbi:MAG: type II toxin-antitoxin system RelE/ParE family toxin, partial [Lachnospiraceae bacterium]|nr:type II toxin-antitoxin system RelE/ParE family toxin [Lachnospiraceae bacterium]
MTQKAIDDLDGIVSYIAVELANPISATGFVDKLQSCIEESCLFSISGSIVINEFLPDLIVRKKIVNNNIIYYLSNSEEKLIMVLRIVYGRR